MLSEDRRVLAVAGFAALCCFPPRALALSAPSLGNAAGFAVLGGSSVTNSGPTIVTGNLGVSPGSMITGFPPGMVRLGDTFKNDALAKAAHSDAGIAYTQLVNQTPATTVPLSGTLPPGTYHFSTATQLTGALTLDAGGDPSAVWIFQIDSTLTINSNSCVLAINRAQPGNVFWQVSGSATLGADSAFVGNLIAHDNITLNFRASAFGRLLALTGTVTLDSNIVTLCSTCNAINLDPLALPDGTTGKLYSQTLIRASGGAGAYTFKRISGSLPSGLNLAPDGVLSGTPMESGSFPITVAATDSQGCSGERAYTIFVACPLTAISPPALPNGSVNMPYSQQLTASCGTPPCTFTTASGLLPPGFPPLPPSGLLSGTPTAAGVYHFRVMATDSNGCSGTIDYTLFICPLTISPPTLPSGTLGTQYNQPITANDGSGSYTFSVPANTLPPGLKLCPANPTTGLSASISGAPTTIGSFTFTVTAIDTVSGCAGSQTYTIMVTCGLTFSPDILSMATLGIPYNETITASGGNGSYTFSVSSGALPTGTTLNPATGKISGTPTALGSFSFCITAIDTSGCTGMQCYTIVVAVGGPTLSGWGMLVLGLLLVGAGLIVIRR